MRVYFDSSVFAKRYIAEAGTAAVMEWRDRASELALSVVAVPELVSAFRRLLPPDGSAAMLRTDREGATP